MTEKAEKRRLENLRLVWRSIDVDQCLKVIHVRDYPQGFVHYAYGHYPSRQPYTPDEKDWQLLKECGKNGVDAVILWGWHDFAGIEGKGVLTAREPEGLKKFVQVAHKNGLKVLPYTSTSWCDVRDGVYRPEWGRGFRLDEMYYRLERCCPGAPSWRTFYLGKVECLFEKFGIDGVYNDSGFAVGGGCQNEAKGHIHLSEDEKGFASLCEDFQQELYTLVKRHHGLLVFFYNADQMPPFRKFWDYLLVGEGIRDLRISTEKTKHYPLYVLRYPDWSRLITDKADPRWAPDLSRVDEIENLMYACTIPYMQFTASWGGFHGEAEDVFTIPGVEWLGEEDGWTRWHNRLQELKEKGLKPPALDKERWYKLLGIYKQMTKDGSVAFMEVKGKNDFLSAPLTEKMVASIFVNEDIYFALSNLGFSASTILLKTPCENLLTGETVEDVLLHPGMFAILALKQK